MDGGGVTYPTTALSTLPIANSSTPHAIDSTANTASGRRSSDDWGPKLAGASVAATPSNVASMPMAPFSLDRP